MTENLRQLDTGLSENDILALLMRGARAVLQDLNPAPVENIETFTWEDLNYLLYNAVIEKTIEGLEKAPPAGTPAETLQSRQISILKVLYYINQARKPAERFQTIGRINSDIKAVLERINHAGGNH